MTTKELINESSQYIVECVLRCKDTINQIANTWGDRILERIDLLIILAIIIAILCIAILWNQRKIKKMLRRLEEQNVSSDEAKAHKESEKQ